MKLYLLRHGEAVEHGDARFKEAERPLTPRGIQRTRQLAHTLDEKAVAFESVFSSPLTRCRQTAEIVGRRMKIPVEFTEALLPFGSINALVALLDGLRPAPKSVLLVGHEPYLSTVISLLCIGGPGLPLRMKKGALVRLAVERLACGKCATLEWVLPPRLVG
jgi:phosphohistidine phosphatase